MRQPTRLSLYVLWTFACLFLACAPAKAAQDAETGEPEKLKIAILEFDAVNEEAKKDNKGRMIAEIFTTAAFKSGLFQVVERHLIQRVMNEMEFGESAFSGSNAQKIGALLGADAVLTGAVSDFLGVLRIDARLINVKDGRVLLADGSQAELNMGSISRAVSELMQKMIVVLQPDQPAAPALAQAPQQNDDAFQQAQAPAAQPLETNQNAAAPPASSAYPVPGQNWTDQVTGMEFVWIPGGNFIQGSPPGEPGRDRDEGRQNQYVEGLWIGKTEVTVAQFRQFVQAQNYLTDAERQGYSWVYTGKKAKAWGENWQNPRFPQTDQDPVINVSWNDAMAFVRWLSAQSDLPYQLPSETVWEYGCRAGAQGRYFWGNAENQACASANVHDWTSKQMNGFKWQAFPCNDGHAQTSPVASLRPNAFGLYDMLGNVWEWTQSTASKGRYIARGGSWDDHKKYVRCANKDKLSPNFRTYSLGFRLMLP